MKKEKNVSSKTKQLRETNELLKTQLTKKFTMKKYTNEDWSKNSNGIFVTGSYDDFNEVARRVSNTEWEIIRYYYSTETYERQGENCFTSYIREMMNEQGFNEDEINIVLKIK